jgi:predicted TIM-barrel fold metal-dependent hydrolase
LEDRGLKDRDSLQIEAPLEPELPICDAHHHLWERPPHGYLLDDLLLDLGAGHNIVSTVAIECHYGYRKSGPEELWPVGEVEFLEAVAQQVAANPAITSRIAGAIVGHANLARGDAVAAVLEAHLAASPTRFRGIRHSTTWDASDALRSEAAQGSLAEDNFCRGFAWLEKFGLSFDAWVYHPQLPEVAQLARRFPGITIIVNHIGAPLGVGPYAGKRNEVFQEWSQGIAAIAACPNVAVKLGGVGSLRSGYDWHERAVKPSSQELALALKPYFEHCIERFGVERCMFESNFPVEKSSNGYVNLWNAFKRITQHYSISERGALFHDTAARLYRIG